ncbi:tetratricopeptide repeat protein [bacterium]|nr:tetratricopeptide repeat protein [bacterium]
MRVSIFSDPQRLSQAKIYYYSGKISKAFILLNNVNIKNMGEDEVLFFAILNSDLGNYCKANDLFIGLSPIKNKEKVGIPFLRNLYRWKRLRQAELYIPKLKLNNYDYNLICGEIFNNLKKYPTAIEYFLKAADIRESAFIYYNIAKCYYLLGNKINCDIFIYKGLEISKGRMIKFNLKKLKELVE